MTLTDLVWIDETGYNYADYPSFLAYFTEQYQAIYGADVYLGSDSQDGQWVAIQAQAAYDSAALGATTYASFSPATAQGVGLSRVVKINGIKREATSNSTVELTLTGSNGTVITDGIAVDNNQQQWAIPSPTTIPSSGSITVTATAVQPGAIKALAHTITGIFTPTRGWQLVDNATDATPGTPVETDAALRSRQQESVANPAQTIFEGTKGAIKNLSGVIAVKGYENDSDAPDTNGLPSHSISFVVSGGTDADIAQAIRVRKTPGVATYGTTAVTLADSEGMPVIINFFRPTLVPIDVQLTLIPGSSWVATNKDIIAAAITNYINSQIEIGAPVVLTELFAVAYVPGSAAAGSFKIAASNGIEICKAVGGTLAAADVPLAFNEEASCDAGTNITFVGV